MPKHRNYSLEEPIGFTRVSEDVLVPSWIVENNNSFELDKKHPFKSQRFIWYGLIVLFLFLWGLNRFDFTGLGISLSLVIILGLGWYVSILIPPQWIEFNRKDGFITYWRTKKKNKIIAQAHFDQLKFNAVRRKASTNGKLGRIEYRYLICLEYIGNRKKKLFFDLFELFDDGKRSGEISAEGFSVAWSLTQSIEQFVRKFMQGELVPVETKSSYKFKFK